MAWWLPGGGPRGVQQVAKLVAGGCNQPNLKNNLSNWIKLDDFPKVGVKL